MSTNRELKQPERPEPLGLPELPELRELPELPLGRHGAAQRRAAGFVHEAAAATEIGALINDTSEQHALVIAPTGAGKGRNVLLPWLLSYQGSIVVVDPKGEAASVTARCRHEFGQAVCVVDPWRIYHRSELPPNAYCRTTATINPLQVMLEDSHDLGDDCLALAELIVGPAPVSLQDPFWRSLALHLITALIGWAWVRADVTGTQQADDGTLAGAWNVLQADDMTYLLASILDTHGKKPNFPRFVNEGFTTYLQHEGERVRTSVKSEAVALLRIFGSARVQAATSQTTVPMHALRQGHGVSVYLLVPPDRLESHAAYLRILLGTLLSVMSNRQSRPQLPTLFLVDELGHLGAITQIKQAVTLLRGYGVRVALFVQSLGQIKSLWPHDHESILQNCGLWLNFGNTKITAARQVAEQLGDISAEVLMQMGGDSIAIHRAGQPTLTAQRLDYLHDPLFKGRFDANPFYADRRAGGGQQP
jgi:type IV secretion system protein VirD4